MIWHGSQWPLEIWFPPLRENTVFQIKSLTAETYFVTMLVNTLKGRSKRPISCQRTAGWCKAAGKRTEIPPGVACLK